MDTQRIEKRRDQLQSDMRRLRYKTQLLGEEQRRVLHSYKAEQKSFRRVLLKTKIGPAESNTARELIAQQRSFLQHTHRHQSVQRQSTRLLNGLQGKLLLLKRQGTRLNRQIESLDQLSVKARTMQRLQVEASEAEELQVLKRYFQPDSDQTNNDFGPMKALSDVKSGTSYQVEQFSRDVAEHSVFDADGARGAAQEERSAGDMSREEMGTDCSEQENYHHSQQRRADVPLPRNSSSSYVERMLSQLREQVIPLLYSEESRRKSVELDLGVEHEADLGVRIEVDEDQELTFIFTPRNEKSRSRIQSDRRRLLQELGVRGLRVRTFTIHQVGEGAWKLC